MDPDRASESSPATILRSASSPRPPGSVRADTSTLVSKNTRGGGSQYISNYNSTVRTAAGNGHPDLYRFRNQFDAVACTRDDDARDNTDTNPNSDGAGEPIYWVRGEKVADHYADFYNSSWDSSRDARVWEDGTPATGNDRIWTGCQNNGTEKIQYDLTYALRNSGGAHDPDTGERVASLTRLDLFFPLDAGTGSSQAPQPTQRVHHPGRTLQQSRRDHGNHQSPEHRHGCDRSGTGSRCFTSTRGAFAPWTFEVDEES